jgi:hypothetical protein
MDKVQNKESYNTRITPLPKVFGKEEYSLSELG